MTEKDEAREDQINFVRKVIGIVAAELAVTFAICIPASFSPSFGEFCASVGCQITAVFVYLFSFIALFCAPGLRKSVPMNYIVMTIFTASMGFMIGGWCNYLEGYSVLMAIGVLMIVLGCIFFSCLAIDNMAKAALKVCLGIIAACILQMVVMIPLALSGAFEALYILYCFIGVLVSAGLIYLDVFIIMLAGKHAMDEYILCSLYLYIDIIRLLIYLLMIFGKGK